MVWHVLGLLTLFSQVGGAGWLVRHLYRAGKPQHAWLHPVSSPRFAAVVLETTDGNHYIGPI